MASPQAALAQILRQIDSPVSAAYLHGLWCGRIVAGESASIAISELDSSSSQSFSTLDSEQLVETDWWRHTQAVLDSDNQVDGPYIKALGLIYGYAEEALASDALDFELWLVTDADSLQLRLEDLADWTQGFLEGFAAILGERMLDIGDDAKELIEDLVAIGELDPEDETSEDTASSAEFEFLQIEEFVKTAVLHFWHDLRIADRQPEQPVQSDKASEDTIDAADRLMKESKGPTIH